MADVDAVEPETSADLEAPRPAPAVVGLGQRLRAATQPLHTEAERAGIMRRLLRGSLDVASYSLLLRNLHAIYEALEQGLRQHATHAALAPLLQDDLCRAPALAQDLLKLRGPAWQREIALVPAASKYADHLQKLGRESPLLLAAHAYVRYLGDLNGGQALARIVVSTLGQAAHGATTFYDFGTSADVALRTATFRAALERVPANDAEAQALVAEACSAFERHRVMFEQLDRV